MGAYFFIKGAVRAFSSPMASDKASVPANNPPIPKYTLSSTAIASTAPLAMMMVSKPKHLASFGASKAPRANIGIGIAPSSPMADTDKPKVLVNIGATDPIITIGERILIANKISVMISKVMEKWRGVAFIALFDGQG